MSLSFDRSIFNPSPDGSAREQRLLLQTGVRIDRSLLCALARGTASIATDVIHRNISSLQERRNWSAWVAAHFSRCFLLVAATRVFAISHGHLTSADSHRKAGWRAKSLSNITPHRQSSENGKVSVSSSGIPKLDSFWDALVPVGVSFSVCVSRRLTPPDCSIKSIFHTRN